MSIGNNIYKLRTAKNLSQGDLADQLDVSRQSVSKWETDAAVPDLDKLMKLCDLFNVSLDEITDRETHKQEHDEIIKYETKSSSAQKIIGYILFAFSLLLGFVVLIFGYNPGDYLILLPTALSFLVSGLLCLFAGKKAFYWCIWTFLAPLTILTPHFIGLAFLQSLSIAMLIVFMIMFFVARAVFNGTVIKTTPKKTLILILTWILPFGLYGALVCLHTMQIIIRLPSFVYGTFFDMLLNLVCYILIALLETYTVCYIQNLRRK